MLKKGALQALILFCFRNFATRQAGRAIHTRRKAVHPRSPDLPGLGAQQGAVTDGWRLPLHHVPLSHLLKLYTPVRKVSLAGLDLALFVLYVITIADVIDTIHEELH